jgi:uncharacterized protein (TIGR02145 family)
MNRKPLPFILVYIALIGCQSNNVRDVDGNKYNIVKIGTQVWLKENLKTTRYRNGDIIGTTTPATLVIEGESTPRYQWAYDGKEINVLVYGRLYTWYVATDVRKICPTGWHVPDDKEWTILTSYLTSAGYGYGGGYLGMDIAKSMSATAGWVADETPGSPGNDQPGNNRSGFTAVPCGGRLEDGSFRDQGHIATWWSTTEGPGFMQCLTGEYVNSPGGMFRDIYHDYFYVNSYCNNKKYGMAIRCLKD